FRPADELGDGALGKLKALGELRHRRLLTAVARALDHQQQQVALPASVLIASRCARSCAGRRAGRRGNRQHVRHRWKKVTCPCSDQFYFRLRRTALARAARASSAGAVAWTIAAGRYQRGTNCSSRFRSTARTTWSATSSGPATSLCSR